MDVSEMTDELDDHGFEDTPEARKVAVINDAIWDICSREPWPFMETTTSLTLTASDDTPAMPSDFRAATALIIPSLGQILTPERSDTVTKNYAGSLTTTGVPHTYYFIGDQLYVYPVPSTTYTATLRYLRWHPEVTISTVEANVYIPARHHRCIVLGALARLYAMEDDPELSVMFDGMFERRLKLMLEDCGKKQYDRPDRVVDLWDGDSDWIY